MLANVLHRRWVLSASRLLRQAAPQLTPLFTGEEPAAILPFDRPPRSAMASEELTEEEQLVRAASAS